MTAMTTKEKCEELVALGDPDDMGGSRSRLYLRRARRADFIAREFLALAESAKSGEEMLSALAMMLRADAGGDHENGLCKLNSKALVERIQELREILRRNGC